MDVTDLPPASKMVPLSPQAREKLDAALRAARKRGDVRAAEVLDGADMLTVDEMAEVLQASRHIVNAKRQAGELLAISGAKRGFRYPKWQLNQDGRPYLELPQLHRILGGTPWTVFRFLQQAHPELEGRTGLEGLASGLGEKVLEAADNSVRSFA